MKNGKMKKAAAALLCACLLLFVGLVSLLLRWIMSIWGIC